MKILTVLLLSLLFTNHINASFPIEHWIVVMMENRSFDHMIGFLKQINSEIEGLYGNESCPYDPFNPNSPHVQVNPFSPDIDPNAGHQTDDTTQQVFGGENMTFLNPPPMNGFVANAEKKSPGWGKEVMSCFNASSLSIMSTLIKEFALIDHWYSSIPGPTEVNRAFLHSCTSNGYAANDPEELALGFPQKTLQQSLMEAGKSWSIYYELVPSAFFMRELRWYPLNFETLFSFYTACEEGTLPTYSFIEPRYLSITEELLANDQHPSHEISQGELFLKNIYEAVRASPLWNKTALLIIYDEHGGYYDHVPTPLNIPNPDGKVSQKPNFDFKRSGVRVPAVIVSPWVKKGSVIHRPNGPTPTSEYEHCSIAATFKKLYNLPNFLTKRDEWAGTFDNIFLDLESPRTDCPTKLPDVLPNLVNKPDQLNQPIHELQISLVHLANKLGGKNDDLSKIKTERQAGIYVQQRVNDFIKNYKEKMVN